ncbi:hypothetical protein IVA80_10770 [Bradyrhizobium sp. 139]|uniref:hypothetical protein n=1 Tax=Bradyrhizobium sp. 139 TaxID=2782616 RepID=UPI001FFC06A4|nr:hypothetical protein [Bradyrhizobium sp. 139]MCK1741333.1 hypothetical protein [Bradyrhizobium sp. 139]
MSDEMQRVVATPCFGIAPATRTYLSEDFAFCKRWTDIQSSLDHVGPSVVHGDIASQFAPSPAAAADAA